MTMNKFDLINKVMVSNLRAEDKCLLVELIMRANDQGESWPSVQRLCKVRGIKHEKNFKGADHYLPGLVTKKKKGRKNVYVLNTPAVEGLLDAEVSIKHTPNTPAVEGVLNPASETDTPAVEGVYTPAVADNTPSVEGANSTSNTTRDSSSNNPTVVADAPTVGPSSNHKVKEGGVKNITSPLNLTGLQAALTDSPTTDTPATEGLSDGFVYKNRRYFTKAEVEEAMARDRLFVDGGEW